jgi:hypothetical protein
MINTIKWTIYNRAKHDKERSKLIYELIFDKLGCSEWGDEWSTQQEELFYEQIDLLLPLETLEDITEFVELVKSVFGEVEVKNQ